VTDQLAEMQTWLANAGIQVQDLEPVAILKARVTFRATFQRPEDAERFVARFGESGAVT
jgi:hypothetical protein